MDKLIVIVGPTSSGKSELAVKLALRFQGEIISADSRQVYTGMDLGTGKITKEEMRDVPHHLLDVVSPSQKFSVTEYRKLALNAIGEIRQREHLPFLVGGSPFYIYAVTDGLQFPEVPPDEELREELNKLSAEELSVRLEKQDPERAKTIEQKNKRRLIRALEIVGVTGKPVPALKKDPLPYPVLFLGIRRAPEELLERIQRRLEARLELGMVKEVEQLHNPPAGGGLSWERLEEFGLEYRYIAQYLQQKISHEEMKEKILKESLDFARRQMLWFKKDERIQWIETEEEAMDAFKKILV